MGLGPDVAADVLRLTTGRLDGSAAAAAVDGTLVRAARAYVRATRARRGIVFWRAAGPHCRERGGRGHAGN
jgi:hypothetical protein